ncbi:MAG: hypothetical protein F9K34_08865 [Albidovulum sp.]|uniref:hypothetical protein n=1 Tax=Albidovulum sp. TaxID=1872424 RepID=UPI001326BB6F|nr:hypothetical protein [Defluviimonas sp.]KAB2884421.1 MAG: hypothetical protein F9K34_08865 [Defluviimonas sp.]
MSPKNSAGISAGHLAGVDGARRVAALQSGRLVPLALDATAAGLDAASRSLATFGLSQCQIDAAPVATVFSCGPRAALRRMLVVLARLLRPGYD